MATQDVMIKQALILVNYGTATGGDILALAEAIRNSVFERFGVFLGAGG
ncbi:MAG: hypothetical protein MZV63_38325 [Marinilabiliales bacterium]|nr:hypothetical protein [Marinilabiliales bacterium]